MAAELEPIYELRTLAFRPHVCLLGNTLWSVIVLPSAWPIFNGAQGESNLETTLQWAGFIAGPHQRRCLLFHLFCVAGQMGCQWSLWRWALRHHSMEGCPSGRISSVSFPVGVLRAPGHPSQNWVDLVDQQALSARVSTDLCDLDLHPKWYWQSISDLFGGNFTSPYSSN